MSSPERERRQQRAIMQAQERQFWIMKAKQQEVVATGAADDQHLTSALTQPQRRSMGSSYDDVILVEPSDLDLLTGQPMSRLAPPYRAACEQGDVSTIRSLVSAETRTPAFLHWGLVIALKAGQVEAARLLLDNGAPILCQTAAYILQAPASRHIALFDLLAQNGWTPNTPGYYGAVLLPKIVTNIPLLRWFLAHDANPNLGEQRGNRDRFGGPDAESCAALEAAAAHGTAEAVEMLLRAGARVDNGSPLLYAAGVCPAGTNPHEGSVKPSKEFDMARIPVMEVLIRQGGVDVNHKSESRHVEAQYAIVHSVMAGAVERTKWLLDHGADPCARGGFGSAAEYAEILGNVDIINAVREAIVARESK